MSGYCECSGGRRVERPAGCSHEEAIASCASECARGETAYEVLGVAPDATELQLKQAFRRLSLKLHPDKVSGARRAIRRGLRRVPHTQAQVEAGASSSHKLASERRFTEVREAYELLTDADRRVLYDMHGYEVASRNQQNPRVRQWCEAVGLERVRADGRGCEPLSVYDRAVFSRLTCHLHSSAEVVVPL